MWAFTHHAGSHLSRYVSLRYGNASCIPGTNLVKNSSALESLGNTSATASSNCCTLLMASVISHVVLLDAGMPQDIRSQPCTPHLPCDLSGQATLAMTFRMWQICKLQPMQWPVLGICQISMAAMACCSMGALHHVLYAFNSCAQPGRNDL